MIQNSFIILEKVGLQRERSLWKMGVQHWQDFVKKGDIEGISSPKKQYYNRRIAEAQNALSENNSFYFIDKLPSVEMWRLYGSFKEESCFLDIETDSYGKITVVGISNYFNTDHFVQGVNLDKGLLERELGKYKLLITFNGNSFDLPKLRKQFQLNLTIPHIDLKPLCVKLGLNGGLKEIEKKLNLKRPAHLYGNPVDLWKAFHASGDKEYLDLLLDYNREDCENLKGVMGVVYSKLYASRNAILRVTKSPNR